MSRDPELVGDVIARVMRRLEPLVAAGHAGAQEATRALERSLEDEVNRDTEVCVESG